MIPCGIEGRGVTSLEKVLQERGDMDSRDELDDSLSLLNISKTVLRNFENVFCIKIQMGDELR